MLADLHFFGVPRQVLKLAGFNLTKVLLHQIYVASWCYKLKIDSVQLPCNPHISLNEGSKPGSFQFTECICVGYKFKGIDVLLRPQRAALPTEE